MRAMILSAGRGERMRPLTLSIPKPLVTIKGKPLIVYHIERLVNAGIQDIVINLGYLGDRIQHALGTGENFGVRLHYSHEDPILNTGGGILQALALLGSEPFLVLSADLYTDFPLATLIHTPLDLMHLVLVDNPEFHQHGDYGLNQGQLTLTGERLTFSGIGVLHPDLFKGYPPKAFPLSEPFQQAIQQGRATGEHYTGLWYNVGTMEVLEELNAR